MDSSRIPESLSADLKKAWIPSRRREITDLFRLVVVSFNDGFFFGGGGVSCCQNHFDFITINS